MRTIKYLNGAWAGIQREKIDEAVPDFHDLVSKFRAYLRDRKGYSQGTFVASTLQGEEAPELRKKRENYVYREIHRFKKYPYLNMKI